MTWTICDGCGLEIADCVCDNDEADEDFVDDEEDIDEIADDDEEDDE